MTLLQPVCGKNPQGRLRFPTEKSYIDLSLKRFNICAPLKSPLIYSYQNLVFTEITDFLFLSSRSFLEFFNIFFASFENTGTCTKTVDGTFISSIRNLNITTAFIWLYGYIPLVLKVF